MAHNIRALAVGAVEYLRDHCGSLSYGWFSSAQTLTKNNRPTDLKHLRPWNALNATGICSSSSAHRRFQEWVAADAFVALWEQGLVDYEALQGIDWAWLAMDGAMTKAPLGGKRWARTPRIARGKTGTKRSVLTDGRGVPLGLAVDGANRNDFKMARETIESIAAGRPDATPEAPQGLWLDKGYDYDEVRALLDEFGFTAHIRARGDEAKALKAEAGFKARRWVVERTHSWGFLHDPGAPLIIRVRLIIRAVMQGHLFTRR